MPTPRVRPRRRAVARWPGLGPAAAALLLLGACSAATTRAPRPVPAADEASAGGPGVEPAQILYRVRYEGPAGQGGLRLVLRQLSGDRFQLQASDILGRPLWSLDLADDEVLLVDHREHRSCVAGSELRVPELALRPLPLVAVPRVLAGRVPLPPPAGVADPTDWTDGSGNRWTVRLKRGEPAGWTLWQQGEPRLSWTRQPRGGILSHLAGSQFRWRQVTREALAPGAYRRIEAPAGYPLAECDEALTAAG